MNDDKKIMSIFAQAYQLLAEASKQQPTQEGFQQMLELLGEDGIQECAKVADQGPQAVAQAMVQIIKQKSAQKAANGAKLNYLLKLKGHCPPGYLKNGGRCKPCEQKAAFGNKADMFEKGGDFDRSRLNYSANKNKKTNSQSNLPNDYRTNPENDKPQGSNKSYDWFKLGSYSKQTDIYPIRKPVFQKLMPQSTSYGQIPQYEGSQSTYPYRITREIYEPQIPGFMPGIEGYPRHYNGGVFKFQGGGNTVSNYRIRPANGENSAKGKTKFNRAYSKTTSNSRLKMNK